MVMMNLLKLVLEDGIREGKSGTGSVLMRRWRAVLSAYIAIVVAGRAGCPAPARVGVG